MTLSFLPRATAFNIALAAAVLIHPVEPSRVVPDVGNRAVTVGDTLVPVFAVRTDTIVSVGRYTDATGAHAFVLARSCGVTMAFAGWAVRRNGVNSAPIVRDSVTLSVGAASPSLTGVNGDTTVDLSTLPNGVCSP
jgi:hypothetical protein